VQLQRITQKDIARAAKISVQGYLTNTRQGFTDSTTIPGEIKSVSSVGGLSSGAYLVQSSFPVAGYWATYVAWREGSIVYLLIANAVNRNSASASRVLSLARTVATGA
jgi:hypothetical protein